MFKLSKYISKTLTNDAKCLFINDKLIRAKPSYINMHYTCPKKLLGYIKKCPRCNKKMSPHNGRIRLDLQYYGVDCYECLSVFMVRSIKPPVTQISNVKLRLYLIGNTLNYYLPIKLNNVMYRRYNMFEIDDDGKIIDECLNYTTAFSDFDTICNFDFFL
jgi:hypothetical protein